LGGSTGYTLYSDGWLSCEANLFEISASEKQVYECEQNFLNYMELAAHIFLGDEHSQLCLICVLI
jgi:hypothetical protein